MEKRRMTRTEQAQKMKQKYKGKHMKQKQTKGETGMNKKAKVISALLGATVVAVGAVAVKKQLDKRKNKEESIFGLCYKDCLLSGDCGGADCELTNEKLVLFEDRDCPLGGNCIFCVDKCELTYREVDLLEEGVEELDLFGEGVEETKKG